MVVLLAPVFYENLRLLESGEGFAVENSSHGFPLKISLYRFSHGPGLTQVVFTPSSFSHFTISLALNSIRLRCI